MYSYAIFFASYPIIHDSEDPFGEQIVIELIPKFANSLRLVLSKIQYRLMTVRFSAWSVGRVAASVCHRKLAPGKGPATARSCRVSRRSKSV